MKSFKIFVILFFITAATANGANSEQEVVIIQDGQAYISDDGLGVELKLDRDGNFISLKSTYTQPVELPDRRGISKAYIIAEEKAKANIARFMNQTSTSERIVDEIDSSSSISNRTKSNNQEAWTKENTRKVTESLRELTISRSSAILKGIRVIARAYDEKTEEVTVTVGINNQSIRGANEVKKALSRDQNNPNNTPKNPSSTGNKNYPSSESEIKQAKDFKDF